MKSSIINRKTPPDFKTVERINLIEAVETPLNNGIPLYVIDAGTQDLVKIELIFPAGSCYQPSPLLASTTNAMLNEGTSKYSSEEIAEKIDYYGAFLEMESGKDFAYISLYTLNKHLKNTLPVLEEIVKNSIFPKGEFKTYLQNRKQRFIVNLEKVGIVASKKFNEMLFGNNHPYGHNVTLNDFDQLNCEKIIGFYDRFYKLDSCRMIAAGKIPDDLIFLLNKYFGNGLEVEQDIPSARAFSTPVGGRVGEGALGSEVFIPQKDALQSAIRIGKKLFNKKHSDYMSMQVLNTILGGYFGSRLMANIREDKGYTYGIYSALVSLQSEGCFFISTEVGADVCNKAIDEIYRELKRLREELIPDDELQLVKNYMLGALLRSIDGPFALAGKFKGIMEYGLDYSYYSKFVDTIKKITSVKLNDLANKYLRQEDMYQVVVGKK